MLVGLSVYDLGPGLRNPPDFYVQERDHDISYGALQGTI
jgi:hypothetical protein